MRSGMFCSLSLLHSFGADLNENEIGNEGAAALAGYLQNSHYLLRFGLSANRVGNSGAEALLLAIDGHGHLDKLCLFQNPSIDEETCAKLRARTNVFVDRTPR